MGGSEVMGKFIHQIKNKYWKDELKKKLVESGAQWIMCSKSIR